MQTIALSKLQSDRQLFDRLAETLENEGLVCIPAASGYKLMADLSSPKAVNQLLQAKCRMTNGPALVFVPGQEWVDKLAADVTEEARKLMEQFWPGPVTLLFNAHPDALHPKVEKSLTKAKGWLGVRMPEDPIAQSLLATFGRPIVVSSANLARKGGAHSVAQVKRNFGRTVDILIDAGDLTGAPNSTLVDVSDQQPSVVRDGAVNPDDILGAIAS